MLKKKAQMEIAGLVIIVILISLGMLFLVYFSLSEKDPEKIFTRKNLASSTMAAVMKTTSSIEDGCNGQLSFEKEILDDCAGHILGGDFHIKCSGKNSCEYLDDRIRKILKQTLGYLKKTYDFRADLLTQEERKLIDIPSDKGRCNKKYGDRDQTTYYLNTGSGNVMIRLRVCD